MAEDRILTVSERIDSLVIQTQMKGLHPIAILLGPEEMGALIEHFFPSGRSATQTLEAQPQTYAGLPVSEQAGIDGIALITERVVTVPLSSAPAGVNVRVKQRYVGAFPILF